MRDYIVIGKIRKPFGVKGFTYVEPLTKSKDRFFELKECFIGLNEELLHTVEIESVEPKGDKLTIKFKNNDSRTDIEKYTNYFIYVDSKDAVKLPADKYFFHELEGLSVVDNNGNKLGVVKSIMEMPAQNLFVIDHMGKEVLVPDVEEFVLSIDMKSKTLVLNVIEGLFE